MIVLEPKLPPLTLTGDVALDGLSTLIIGSLSAMVGHQVGDALPRAAGLGLPFHCIPFHSIPFHHITLRRWVTR